MLLSLVSGRNPELLIGQHVKAAVALQKSKLEIIPTAYMMVDGGKITSALYMSGTLPIPADKNEIALSTALAAEMLGFKMLYLEAGSGAQNKVPNSMIKQIAKNIGIPLLVGGGIDSAEKAQAAAEAGAHIVVVGNALEKSTKCIFEITKALRKIKV
jgi:putative glycerol-1-phosphate prenyltransferase